MKLIHILTLAGGVFCLSLQSCDYTDLSPETFVGEKEAFRDVESVGKVVTGTFGLVSLRTSMGISEYIADDVVQGGDAGGAGTNLYAWTYADDGESSAIWGGQYSIINNANRIIHKGGKVSVSGDAEQKKLNNHLGQAYFLRAYAHFELLRFFSDFQDQDALGIPYVTYPHVLGLPPRDKVSDCYDYLMDDLETAYELINNESNKAYATLAAVQALRARISLYRQDYARATAYASEALRIVPMESVEKFADIWSDKTRDGVIFVLPRFKGNSEIGGLFVGSDNSNVFGPSEAYMANYSNEDTRKNVYFGTGPDRGGSIVDRVHKYIGSPSNIGLNDEKVLRSAEMKLIIIESYARRNYLAEANRDLNDFRRLRIKNWTNQSYDSATLLEEILKERRRELAYENHRLFDLRRYKKSIKRDSGQELSADHYRMIMPIPKSEIQANENLKGQQNEGYY